MSLRLSPDFRGDVTISVGIDGRVYFHDLDPELIRLALAVNPDDRLMRLRLAMIEENCEHAGQDPSTAMAQCTPAGGVRP